MRLTQAHRRAIKRELVSQRFDKRLAELENELRAFADDVYQHRFKDEMGLMLSLPNGWLPECEEIKVRLGTHDVCLDLSAPRRIPYEFENQYANRTTNFIAYHETGSAACNRYEKIIGERDTLIDQREIAFRQIDAVLDSLTTDKAAIKAWPEIKGVIERICFSPNVTPLAPRMVELNELLGLTPAMKLAQ